MTTVMLLKLEISLLTHRLELSPICLASTNTVGWLRGRNNMEQKKGFTLPAKPLKAAQYFQAKRDVRFYLNGILVDKAGFIVAGNGHVLIRIESADAAHLDESVIVDVIGNIPQKADLAEFVFAQDDSGIVKFASNFGRSVQSNGRDCMCSFRLIYGKYPDYQKVFKK